MIWNPNTNEQNVICWRLLKFFRRLSNHWNYYVYNYTSIHVIDAIYHDKHNMIYIQHCSCPICPFCWPNCFFSNISSPRFLLLGRSSPSYVRIHHNQGRPVLPRKGSGRGRTTVPGRIRSPKKRKIPYKKDIELITWWNKKRNKKQRWFGK